MCLLNPYKHTDCINSSALWEEVVAVDIFWRAFPESATYLIESGRIMGS